MPRPTCAASRNHWSGGCTGSAVNRASASTPTASPEASRHDRLVHRVQGLVARARRCTRSRVRCQGGQLGDVLLDGAQRAGEADGRAVGVEVQQGAAVEVPLLARRGSGRCSAAWSSREPAARESASSVARPRDLPRGQHHGHALAHDVGGFVAEQLERPGPGVRDRPVGRGLERHLVGGLEERREPPVREVVVRRRRGDGPRDGSAQPRQRTASRRVLCPHGGMYRTSDEGG